MFLYMSSIHAVCIFVRLPLKTQFQSANVCHAPNSPICTLVGLMSYLIMNKGNLIL